MDSNLSVTIVWSTFWFNIAHNWLFIVKILNTLGVHFHFQRYRERNIAWMISRWRETFYFRGGKIFTRNHCLIKFASNISSISEIRTYSNNFGTSTYWTFSGIYIKEIWWSIVVKDVVIISVLLVI